MQELTLSLNAIFTQEDVILLVYFHYQVLRTGDLELYMSVMAQMAILFNIWHRKHCGCDYQKLLYPTTGNAKNSGFSYLWKKNRNMAFSLESSHSKR